MKVEPTPEIPPWLLRRAQAYARSAIVRRPGLRSRFARFAGADRSHDVLDVGAGPGYSSFALARRARSVTALECRPELLRLARLEARRRRLSNIRFVEANPEELPFPDSSFHIVTSSGALHHFADPRRAISEIARVCSDGGAVALEDVITSEHEVRARYHNRLERLRDRSHQRLLPLSEIISLLGRAGLFVRKVEVTDSLREFNEWVSVTRPPPRRAERLRHLLSGSVEQDLSGLRVQPEDDTFLFIQQVAWVRAIKP